MELIAKNAVRSMKAKVIVGTGLVIATGAGITWLVLHPEVKGKIIAAVIGADKVVSKVSDVSVDLSKVVSKIELKVTRQEGLTAKETQDLWLELVKLKLKVCDACISAAQANRTDHQKGWVVMKTKVFWLDRSLSTIGYIKATEKDTQSLVPTLKETSSEALKLAWVVDPVSPAPWVVTVCAKYAHVLGWSRPEAGLFNAVKYAQQAWDSVHKFDSELDAVVAKFEAEKVSVSAAACNVIEGLDPKVASEKMLIFLNNLAPTTPRQQI